MNLKQRIQQDLKKALKEKDESRVSILRMLLDHILKKEKDKRAILKEETDEQQIEEKTQLSEEEAIQAVSMLIKRAKDSVAQFRRGDREDLAIKEEKEISILEAYLPEQLPQEEIRAVIKKAIQETGVRDFKDMGKLMAKVMPELKGKADGATVSQIAKELLS